MLDKYIISIDPSLSSTGFAVLNERNKDIIMVDKITTTNKKAEEERIYEIASTLGDVCKTFQIKTAVSESQFYRRNIKTALQLSRLRGAITYALKSNNIEKEIHMEPATIRKFFMDNSKAKKEDIAFEIQRLYIDNEFVKNLGEFNDKPCKNKNSDMYDAISIGVAYINSINVTE